MNAITIRNLSQHAFETISDAAARNHVSVENEAASLLERAVGYKSGKHDRLDIADAIAAMTPRGVKQIDSTRLIRKDRDR